MSETRLVKSLLQHLNYYGFFWRNNTGAQKITSYSGNRYIRFGMRGSADIIGLVKGRFIAIEVKSPSGRQSINQSEFQRNIEKFGGIYILARTIDDVLDAIKNI